MAAEPAIFTTIGPFTSCPGRSSSPFVGAARLRGGLADMAALATPGSIWWPVGAHWLSANPAGNWRTGGLSSPRRNARDVGTSTAGIERTGPEATVGADEGTVD